MKKKLFVCIMLIAVLAAAMCSMAFAESEDPCANGHSWSTGTAATCGKDGKEICSGCGKERAIPATGNHSYTVGAAATCAKDGKEICTSCGKERAIPATGNHSYTVGTAATCAKDGKEICSGCGKERAIPATGAHNFTVGKEATCVADGKKICSGCGAEEKIPATGVHNYVKVEATCGKAGSNKCSVCGAGEEIPATGAHSWTVGAPATCGKDGKQICSVCGAEEKIPAVQDHSWTVGKEATCGKDGKKICSVCGAEEKIPATGNHSYTSKKVSATTTSKGYTLHTCEVCGDSYKDNYTAKKSSSSKKKVTVTPAPTATPAPAGEYGSIVTDVEFADELYTAEVGTKAVEGVEAENNLLTIVASADENGAYVLRNLHLSLELIAELKADGIEYINFVVGEYELLFPISMFETEEIALIAADLTDELTGYVITVDPNAANENGEVGCTVNAAMASLDGETASLVGFLTGMTLTKGEQEIAVVEAIVYTFAA